MNILHVSPYFAPAWAYGGPPRSILGLCRELARRGHSVAVATTDACDERRRASPPTESIDGVRVFRFPNLSNHLAWRYQLFLPRGLGNFLDAHLADYEVVHVHMYRNVPSFLAHRRARRQRVPIVFSARGSIPRIVRGRTAKAVYDTLDGRRLLRDAAVLVASTRAERDQYVAMGVPPRKIAIVPNGIDIAPYERLPPRGGFASTLGVPGARIIAYLGRLNPRKGLDGLLLAFARLSARRWDAVLVLAGPDEGYRRRLERLAHDLGISHRVVFTGFVDGDVRLQILADAAAVVYPAKHEVFGLVPFEALACGKPIVVADDSGCGELVGEARAGFVVPVDRPEPLEEAILSALEMGADVRAMVDRGRAFVLDRLGWPRIAAEMEAVYGTVMSSRT